MVWYADLSPCNYFGAEFADSLFAIGWLQQGEEFASGRVERAVYDRLLELLQDPWQPAVMLGVHHCDLCLYEGESGHSNLFIPAISGAFVCPELITHYMNSHSYCPPEEFCRAVLTCPPMRSMSYLKAMLAAARPLMQAAAVHRPE